MTTTQANQLAYIYNNIKTDTIIEYLGLGELSLNDTNYRGYVVSLPQGLNISKYKKKALSKTDKAF